MCCSPIACDVQLRHIVAGALSRIQVVARLACLALLFVSQLAMAQQDSKYTLNLPLMLNGQYLGDIAAEVGTDFSASLDAARLMELLDERVEGEVYSHLISQVGEQRLVRLDDLQSDAVDFTFDQAALEIRADVAMTALQANRYSLRNSRQLAPDSFTAPEAGALGIDLTYLRDYNHTSDNADNGFGSPVMTVNVGGNLGGFDGLNLIASGVYDGEREKPWERRDVQLFVDDYEHAVRYSAGDIQPMLFGLQGSPRLGGVSISRRYGDIRPFKNIRPLGARELVLDRPSRVDVEVNGLIVETLDLPAGRFSLTDFPVTGVANNVRLIVEDDLGRREVVDFNIFSDPMTLAPGVTLFSASVGRLEERGSEQGITYQDRTALTAFFERGMNDQLSLGMSTQAVDTMRNLGLRGTYATSFGTFQADAARSWDDEAGAGHAGRLGYAWNNSLAARIPVGFNLNAEGYEANFRTLDQLDSPQTRRLSFGAQLRLGLGNVGLGVTAQTSVTRPDMERQQRYGLNLSRSFNRELTGFVTLDYSERSQEQGEIGVIIGASYRFGEYSNARASYNSANSERSLRVSRYSRQTVGAISGDFSASRSDAQNLMRARAAYYGNRFEAEISGSRTESLDDQRQVRENSRLVASTGIGITSSGVAIGRSAAGGFIMAKPHATLEGRTVKLDRNETDILAESGPLGPALVPIYRGYSTQRLDVNVEDVPLGYDIGNDFIDVLPGAFSGYTFMIGQDEFRTAMGTLRDEAGEPIGLATGSLTPVDGKLQTRTIFTNRAGRFVGEKLGAGEYRLTLNGRAGFATLEIPETLEGGIIDVGTVELAE